MSRKPIFVINVPLAVMQDEDIKNPFLKKMDELKVDYHVIIIENNPCEIGRVAYRVTYELLNGSFWNYLFLWLKYLKERRRGKLLDRLEEKIRQNRAESE